MGRFTSILSLVDNKRLPKKIKPLFFLFFFSPGSLHSWVLWTRPLSPPGATQRLVQSVQGLSKKHNLDKYTSRANDACISDYFTKSEFSANSRRERLENQRLKLFLVSEFQIPAKANRGPEENLKKRDTKLIPRQSPQRQLRYEKKNCPIMSNYNFLQNYFLSPIIKFLHNLMENQ